MSHVAFWTAFAFATFAGFATVYGRTGCAVFSGLLCLLFAIDGAAKVVRITTVVAPPVPENAGRDRDAHDSTAPAQ